MRYTWAKLRLCRREWINLFGSAKYALGQKVIAPGQHGMNMQRHSEYWKLLRKTRGFCDICGAIIVFDK